MRAQLILGAVIAVVGVGTHVATAEPASHREGANHHLGDDSFIAHLGRMPSPADSEHDRMHEHLAYVRDLLASRPATSPKLAARRTELLGYLDDYIAAGITPQNTYVPWRNPVFIDAEGRICAVGYLIERSIGRALPEAIAKEHRLDYLEDLAAKLPDVASWVASSGFTLDELASIQPGYEGPDVQHLAGWSDKRIAKAGDGPYHQTYEALVIDGAFDHKHMTGPWKITTKAGKLVGSGTFKRGAGTWTSVRLDGSKMAEGPFSRDHAEGDWKFYHPSGHLAAMGSMHEGKRTGTWTFYYDSAKREKVSVGAFVDGEVRNTWRHYDQSGNLVATTTGRPWKKPLDITIESTGGIRREMVQGEPASSHAVEGIYKGSDKLYIENRDTMFDGKGNALERKNGTWTATPNCLPASRKAAAARGDARSLYGSGHESTSFECKGDAKPLDAATAARYDALLAARTTVHAQRPTFTFDDVSKAPDEAAANGDDSSVQSDEASKTDLANNESDLGNYLSNHMGWYMEWHHVDAPFMAAYGTMPGYGYNRFASDDE